MNSACGACWLASSEVISQVIFTSEHRAAYETLKIDHLCVKFSRYICFWRYLFNFDRWCTLKQLSTSVSVNSDIDIYFATPRLFNYPALLTFTIHQLFFLFLFFFLKVRQLYSGTDEASLAFLRVEVTGFMWVPYTEFRYGSLYRRKTCPVSVFLLHFLVTRLSRIQEARDTLIVRSLINGYVRANTHTQKTKPNKHKNKQKKNAQKHWTNGIQ